MNQNEIKIRQACIDDKDRIWAFLKLAYGERSKYKFPDRWNWQYVNNPYWNENKLPIWIALRNNKVIGQSNAMIVPLKIGSNHVMAGWSNDTVVLTEFRGEGIGTRLQNAKLRYIKNYMAINISEINKRIMANMGARKGNEVSILRKYNYIKKNNVESFLLYQTKNNKFIKYVIYIANRYFILSSILTYLFNLFIKVKNIIDKPVILDNDIIVKAIKQFGSEIDLLWDSSKDQYSVSVVRNHRYLNWKYCFQPHMNYSLFIATKGNKTCGYSILRKCTSPEPNKGIIVDLYASRNDIKTFEILIDHAISYFGNEVRLIEGATSVNEIKKVYKKYRFSVYSNKYPMFFSSEVNDWHQLIEEGDNWFLAKGSSDWDQYPNG